MHSGLRLSTLSVVYAAALFAALSASPRAEAAEPDASADGAGSLRVHLEAQGYICVELQRLHAGYLTTDMKLGAAQLHLIVDTGAPNTHLDRARTEALRLPWEERRSAGPGSVSHAARIGELEFGTLKTGEFLIGSDDVTELNRVLAEYQDPAVDGVLGNDVLTRHSAVIDYVHDRMFLKPSAFDSKTPALLPEVATPAAGSGGAKPTPTIVRDRRPLLRRITR